jgi:hypothetical protein
VSRIVNLNGTPIWAVLVTVAVGMLLISACDTAGDRISTPTPKIGVETTVTAQGEGKMKGYPADFSVKYDWRAGTMPPPHHYEYSVRIAAGAQGEVTFWPDYVTNETPTWTESFDVSANQLSTLYSLMVEKKVLREDWRRMEFPPVGGSLEDAEIVADGKRYSIPSDIEPAEKEVVAEVYTTIMETVPQAVWDKLMAQREQYVEEYEKRHR